MDRIVLIMKTEAWDPLLHDRMKLEVFDEVIHSGISGECWIPAFTERTSLEGLTIYPLSHLVTAFQWPKKADGSIPRICSYAQGFSPKLKFEYYSDK